MSKNIKTLSLSQRFYLLQLRKNNKSHYVVPSNAETYLFGITLLELRLKKIIDVDSDSKVTLLSTTKTGVDYLDNVIAFLSKNSGKKVYDLIYSYVYAGQLNEIKLLLHNSLDTQIKVGGELDEELLTKAVESLRAELLEPGKVSDENKALILLLDTSNYDKKLSKYYFSAYEQSILNDKIKEIKAEKDDLTGDLIAISNKYQGGFKDFFSSMPAMFNPKNMTNESNLWLDKTWFSFVIGVLFAIWGVVDILNRDYWNALFNFILVIPLLASSQNFYDVTKLKVNMKFVMLVNYIFIGLMVAFLLSSLTLLLR